MNQVELLLRLSENAQDKGEELTRQRDAYNRELQELWGMIEQARQNVWTLLSRFGGLNEDQRAAQAETRAQIARTPQQGPRVIRHAEETTDAATAGNRPRDAAQR
jgi:hypothetical protein